MDVRIKTCLSTNMYDECFELYGNFDSKKKILSYIEKDFNIDIDLKNHKMVRKNDEYSITFNINMNNDNYLDIYMIDSMFSTRVPVKYEFIDIRENSIETKYITVDNGEEVNYRVSWEEVE